MKNLEDIKEEKNELNDEELDTVTGGVKIFPVIPSDRTMYTTTQQLDETGNNC